MSLIFSIACDPACVRGTCTEDRVCACPEGWIGEDCNTPSKRTIVIDHNMYNCVEWNISQCSLSCEMPGDGLYMQYNLLSNYLEE